MNIAKNMEAIFVAALVVIGATSFAAAAVPKLHHATVPAAAVTVKTDGAMPVVVVTAKRLTAAEKAAL